MAMYHQQASYSSPSYETPYNYASTSSSPYGAYSQQHAYVAAPPPQPTPPPQPAQPTAYEIQRFREWFDHELSRLVENNRQVIHRLAYIAREHVQHYAGVMSQCLEAHIRRAHPAIKLPAFYLLDSISKNLGYPYTSSFAEFIAPLFLEAYNVVDESIRGKMEEMLVTWRTGGPHGVELFTARVQSEIESFVWGSRSTGPTQNQVLLELDVILAQKNRAVHENPSDMESRGHIEVLNQLKGLVLSSSMSPDDLNAIYGRIRDLARSTASSAPPAAPMPPPPAPATYSQPGFPASAPQPPPSSSFSSPAMQGSGLSSVLSSLISQSSIAASASSSSSPTPTGAVPDISQLFKSLVAAGIVSQDASSSTKSEDDLKNVPVFENKSDAKFAAIREYEKQILSLSVSLSGLGLQRSQPKVVASLYEDLPLKCKQCAKRFADDEVGRAARDDHLDFHFRQNTRASQALGRGHTRSWFVGTDDWIHDVAHMMDADSKGKGRAEYPPTSAKGVAAAAAALEATLRQKYVVVAPGDESKTITCPICKDTIPMEFTEDDEEWVWRNAVRVKGKVYHATCHADAQSSAAARLRLSSKTGTPLSRSSRSRSGTPEAIAHSLASGKSPTRATDSNSTLDSSASSSSLSRKRKSYAETEDEDEAVDAQLPTVAEVGEVAQVVKSEDDGEPAAKRARPSVPS